MHPRAIQAPTCLYRRYQYLSFVSFLSKGLYMAPWAHGDVRSLAVEREWDGWDDFFKSGSAMLASVSLLCLLLNLFVCRGICNTDQCLLLAAAPRL